MPENNGNGNLGFARSVFWIVTVAFTIMVIIAVSLWGCERWKQTKGHTEPQSRNAPAKFLAPPTRAV
jgi:hypothetical protein